MKILGKISKKFTRTSSGARSVKLRMRKKDLVNFSYIRIYEQVMYCCLLNSFESALNNYIKIEARRAHGRLVEKYSTAVWKNKGTSINFLIKLFKYFDFPRYSVTRAERFEIDIVVENVAF